MGRILEDAKPGKSGLPGVILHRMNLADLWFGSHEALSWAHCMSELQIAPVLAEIFQAREDIEDMIQRRLAESWPEEREWLAAFFG